MPIDWKEAARSYRGLYRNERDLALMFAQAIIERDRQAAASATAGEGQAEEIRALRAALEAIYATLQEAEWRPKRNMSGGITNFCPVCGGTPSVYKNNPKSARPDGHWLDGIWVRGECPIAKLLDMTRAALSAGARAEGQDE